MKKPAVFLDFQGTLGGGGTDDIRTLELFPFSADAIKKLNDNGILAIGITNQSHIAKGLCTLDEYNSRLEYINHELEKADARLDEVYCCPHGDKDTCTCKKPLPGMIEWAKRDFSIDPTQMYVVGDMGKSDMLLAKNVGAKAVLVLTGVGRGSLNEFRHTWAEAEATHVADNVYEAVRWIIDDIANYSLSVYNPGYCAEPPEFIRQLADTPAMRRLANVGMNCGCEYTGLLDYGSQQFRYTRWTHSIYVAQIIWHFTGDIRQTIAGLFHDIATPAFAHVIDFLNGDHISQESTEDKTLEFIALSTEITDILREYGLSASDVSDYHIFPIADNDTPMLSADRLEYTLGNAFNRSLLDLNTVKRIYNDLRVVRNEHGADEIAFADIDTALLFTSVALDNSYWYVSDEDRLSMQLLADIIRYAIVLGLLTASDLYTTETRVIDKLTSDVRTRALWHSYTQMNTIDISDRKPRDRYAVNISAKRRYIDPLISSTQNLRRVSAADTQAAHDIDKFLHMDFDKWLCPIPASPVSLTLPSCCGGVTALFFDLDGTLLTDEKTISPTTLETLRLCKSAGLRLFIATARAPLLQSRFAWYDDIRDLLDGGSYYNGGCVISGAQKSYTFISDDIVQAAIDLVNGYDGLNISLQMEDEYHAFRFPLKNPVTWGIPDGKTLYLPETLGLHSVKILIFYADLVDSTTVLDSGLVTALEALCAGKAQLYLTDSGKVVQIMGNGVNKLQGIERLRTMLGIEPREIAVFGDDINDIEMLSAYEHSVVMGNASDDIKNCARYVTNDNNSDGISYAIREILRLI